MSPSMKLEQKVDIKFEKFNSKYNRIWEQLTNISIFVLTTVSGYLIALSTIQRNVNNILKIEFVNYILLMIGIILGFGYGILITHLLECRKQIKFIFEKYKIS